MHYSFTFILAKFKCTEIKLKSYASTFLASQETDKNDPHLAHCFIFIIT